MHNTNFVCGAIGHVVEIPTHHTAVIEFEIYGAPEKAFLRTHRFYKDGKHLEDHQSLDKLLKVGHKVKFSCHLNDHPDAGQCKWFVTNCFRQIEEEHKLIISGGIMNVSGTVTDLKQRHGTLTMTDLLRTELKVHFLANKVRLFGRKVASSKPLTDQLQIDDKVFFDAIPCFPEENNQNCNWFATCVCKGKKPEIYSNKDVNSKIESVPDIDKEKIVEFLELIKVDDKSVRGETPMNHTDLLIDGKVKDVENLSLNTELSSVSDNDSAGNSFDPVLRQCKISNEEKQNFEVSGIDEAEFFKENFMNLKTKPDQLNEQRLDDIKTLTNDPRGVFVQSEGIILDIINEEYGVILGEFQRNVFQSVLFHRSRAFLFKMSLTHSKLTEIFIEGDRVRFIAVHAPKKFVCDWIATQVSVVRNTEEDEDELDDDLSDDFFN